MEVAGIFLGPIIEMLLEKLVSGAVSNYGREKGIVDQLKKLERMLPDIRAVLADAEDKQMTDGGVKSWMEDLSDLAYDLDDLLDDIATQTLRLELTMPESQASRSSTTSSSSKVRKLLIPTCCTSFTTSPSAAVKLDHNMMSKVDEITTRLQYIETRKNSLDLIANVRGNIGSNTIRESRETTSLVDKSHVYGRVQDKEAIVEQLLREEVGVDKLSIIPIVGMGGLGKTTLAQLVYNDERLEGRFDLKAWVCVSDDFHEYVHRVTKAILEEVTSKTHDSMSLNMLQQKLKENLSGKKFLLVLDDVWNKKYQDWELLKRPFMIGAPGSKIIVTTRDGIVASTMTLSPTYPLKGLSKDECLSLFAHHALERENFDAHQDLKEIGEEIVNKCKGLPLAVKTLASLLRTTRRQSEWVDILNSKIWGLPEQSDILPALRLSYHHLPSHLKQCFAYCATFPKDYEFDKDELVLLWMGVGLLQLPPSNENNRMEDFGYKCFDDLLSRSFFQQSSSNKSRFLMHDLLNDLALHVVGNICFRQDKLEGDTQFEIPKRARHLSYIRQKYEVLQKFRPLCKVQHLRTFLPLSGWDGRAYLANKVLLDLFPKLQCLRVLSLSGYVITELLNSIGDLKHLRYLNLSGTSISRLPESVCTLYNLQTLLLHSCNNLYMMPENIENLINLRHLDITDTKKLQEMSSGIGRLTNLQTLSKFAVGKNNGPGLKELKNLRLLCRSISIEELQNITNVPDANEANLRAKEYLNEVELAWCSEFNNFQNENLELDVLDKLQPHRNLERLKIMFYGGTRFPSWIGDPSLSKMVKLTLVGCRKCKYLPSLGQLPMLKKLRIQSMHEVKKLGDEFYGWGAPFPSLESLIFEDMPAWEEWSCCISSSVDKAARQFPCLVELSLRDCPNLIKVSVLRLPFLHRLHLKECQKVVLKSIVDVTSLTSLKVVNIIGLCHLEEALVQSLVALGSLVVKKCNQVVSLWENGVPCINLEELDIDECVNLEKLPNELSKLTSLTSLKINGCSKLVCFPKAGVPSTLRRLEIRDCNVLESMPEGISGLEQLKINGCESLRSWPIKNMLPTTLKVFYIWNCKNLELVSETMMMQQQQQEELNNINIILSSLETLSIWNWPNIGMLLGCVNDFACLRHLCIINCDSLESLPTNQILQNLERLDIIGCPRLRSFPEERGRLSTPNLRILWIDYCAKLSSLPIDESQSLASLEYIWIYDCPCLESFPQRQFSFSPNLIDLSINRLGTVVKPMSEWGLHRLTSLRSFKIKGVYPELVSFPSPDDDDNEEYCLLPTSLTQLHIKDLPNLKNISSKCFQNLTSLQHLTIEDCPKLKSLPEEGLPSTLHRLQIKKCPDLQKWCSEKDGGDYCPNIAHIPCVQLDNDSD